MFGTADFVRLIVEIVPEGFDDELREVIALANYAASLGNALCDGRPATMDP